MPVAVTTNVTCLGCGCVCDDIEVHTEANRLLRTGNACPLGESWFRGHASADPPPALLDGSPVAPAVALAAAADRLRSARLPLVFGLGSSTCETQREAVRLAEELGGVVDSHTSLTHGPTKIAAQLVGKVVCTLGEVRNRADLVIYWGTNPAESHPRHFSRYTLTPAGKFVPRGRADRTMVLVDVRETPSAAEADLFLRLRPNRDFETLTALRAVVAGRRVDEGLLARTGLGLGPLRDLADRMKQARFGALFFGTGLTGTRGKHLNAAAALALVAELNAFTKFVALPMRDHGNEAGADYVFSWTAGYPLAVDYSRGYPRSNPGEFSAVDLLTRGEADAAVVVGEGTWAALPSVALDHLARIPTVTIGPRLTELSRIAHVHLTAATPGVHTGGTVYRMDKVPLPLRPVLSSPFPREDEWLARLRRAAC